MINRKKDIEEVLDGFRMIKLSATFQNTGSRRLPRITPSQWSVLMLIEQRGSASVKDIASALHVSSSAATQLADALERSGYVLRRRNKSDRRIVRLSLSKKSVRDVKTLKKQAVVKYMKVFEALSDREFGQYAALHRKIMDSLVKT